MSNVTTRIAEGDEYPARPRPEWHQGLTHKDWLLDGQVIRGARMLARFEALDWSEARCDLGPSVTGNLGPYWHVPLPEDGTVHRLYPKVLMSKWIWVMRQAVKEAPIDHNIQPEVPTSVAECEDCGEPYGSPRFPDLVIDNDAFAVIASRPASGGLFCPNCLIARLYHAGLTGVAFKFTTGPLAAADEHHGRYVESAGLLDQWECSCGWKSATYHDGQEYAYADWRKHAALDTALSQEKQT